MAEHQYGSFFLRTRQFAQLVLPTFKINQLAPQPDGPVVYVSHHQNMMGPLSTMIWLPIPVRLWALSFLDDEEACYEQFAQYTFPKRMNIPTKLAQFLARPAAKVSTAMLSSIGMIPVYRQSRKIVYTIRESMAALKERQPLLIFPDINYAEDSEEVGDIYEGFLNLEKYYHRRVGERISFVPLYSDIENHIIHIGEALKFPHEAEFVTERQMVAEALQERLNELSEWQ